MRRYDTYDTLFRDKADINNAIKLTPVGSAQNLDELELFGSPVAAVIAGELVYDDLVRAARPPDWTGWLERARWVREEVELSGADLSKNIGTVFQVFGQAMGTPARILWAVHGHVGNIVMEGELG